MNRIRMTGKMLSELHLDVVKLNVFLRSLNEVKTYSQVLALDMDIISVLERLSTNTYYYTSNFCKLFTTEIILDVRTQIEHPYTRIYLNQQQREYLNELSETANSKYKSYKYIWKYNIHEGLLWYQNYT